MKESPQRHRGRRETFYSSPRILRLCGMNRICFLLLAACCLLARSYSQGIPTEWAPVVEKIARVQDASGAYRDRCIYQMSLSITRFKRGKKDWKEKIISRRESKGEVGPNEKGEVFTRLLADTDEKGRPRRVDPNDKILLATAAFLEALFFPFYPEKIHKYDLAGVERIEEDGQPALAIGFTPKEGIADAPLIEGTGYFLESTGEILRLEIKSLRNFEIIDRSLRRLERFQATVQYVPAGEGRRLPIRASGRGFAKLKHLDGDFQFIYEESSHKLSPHYANK